MTVTRGRRAGSDIVYRDDDVGCNSDCTCVSNFHSKVRCAGSRSMPRYIVLVVPTYFVYFFHVYSHPFRELSEEVVRRMPLDTYMGGLRLR